MSSGAVTFVGHPFATIGVGEQIRSHIRAAASMLIDAKVYDIYGHTPRTDPAYGALVLPREVVRLPAGIRVFHINGDEVEPALAKLREKGEDFADGYNIIVPAWELPTYSERWVEALRRFDEVWALSRFIQSSLRAAGMDSIHIGQSVEVAAGARLPRRYFGLRESAFVFLNFFDTTSFSSRKNPQAVTELFRRLAEAHPLADLQFVLKVKSGDARTEGWSDTWGELPPHTVVLDTPLSSLETLSLIEAADCFVSLHRAEGFGRGLGEAMALGRLALGTGWSGNLDFMSPDNSLVVRSAPTPLREGDYPEWHGQNWAEPDVGHAFELVDAIWSDTSRIERITSKARTDIGRLSGDRAVGARMLARINAVRASSPKLRAAA